MAVVSAAQPSDGSDVKHVTALACGVPRVSAPTGEAVSEGVQFTRQRCMSRIQICRQQPSVIRGIDPALPQSNACAQSWNVQWMMWLLARTRLGCCPLLTAGAAGCKMCAGLHVNKLGLCDTVFLRNYVDSFSRMIAAASEKGL